MDRLRNFVFTPGSSILKHVHVLDLAEGGRIKPHVDSVKFCGDTITGICLLSDAVMRLVQVQVQVKVRVQVQVQVPVQVQVQVQCQVPGQVQQVSL